MLPSTPFVNVLRTGASRLSPEPAPTPRLHPPKRAFGIVVWASWVVAVCSVLSNGSFPGFLLPSASRGVLAAALLLLALALTALQRYGLPATGEARMRMARAAVVPALLVAIVTLAFGLRLSGIESGLPQSYVSDEYDYVASGLTRLKRGDFNPRWWHYPSLHPYLCSATYLTCFFYYVPQGRWSSIHQVVEEDMLYWGRFLSVLFGTATVALTYFLGKRLYRTTVGLGSAALLAVFPGMVEHSQYNKPDVVLYFTVVVSVLVTLVYFERGGARYAVAAGVAIGFVVSSKYNGALVVIPFLLAVVLSLGRNALARADLYVGFGAAALTFAALNPYLLADFPRFVDHVASEIHAYAVSGRPGMEGENNWWTHAVYTADFGAGLLPALFGLAGLVLLLRRLDARTAIFLSFPVAHYAHYSAQKVNWPGNLIPVYAFLAIAAAYAMEAGLAMVLRAAMPKKAQRLEPYAVAALFALTIASPLARTMEHNAELNLPDTGNVARAWIETAFPPGTHFAVERFAPVPDRRRFAVTLEGRIVGKSLGEYRELGVEYLVLSSMVYERFGPGQRTARAYDELFATCPLVKEFRPVEGTLSGPTIRLVSVPAE